MSVARGALPSPAAAPTHAATPVSTALREGLRRFVARRVRPENIDDLVQDILLRMHEHAGELSEEARLAGWAFRIAARVVADHHRARRVVVLGAESPPDVAEAADETNLNEVVAAWLPSMLALLPDEFAEAIHRVDVQGMTQREYAAGVGLSLSGAKSRVQRGRRMLAELVRACCDLELDARGNVIGYRPRACACEGGGCGGPE